jgi:hypothetical protein
MHLVDGAWAAVTENVLLVRTRQMASAQAMHDTVSRCQCVLQRSERVVLAREGRSQTHAATMLLPCIYQAATVVEARALRHASSYHAATMQRLSSYRSGGQGAAACRQCEAEYLNSPGSADGSCPRRGLCGQVGRWSGRAS